MARPLNHPFDQLRAHGDSILVPVGKSVVQLAKRYGARKGFDVQAVREQGDTGPMVRITRQDRTDAPAAA